MIRALKNIWATPDLRRRILFTFAMLGVYRVGAHIPTPGTDPEALLALFDESAGGLLGLADLFSGGAFGNMAIFAMGIMPYIQASIILQLLTVTWPYLERLGKEGEAGRKKITQYTRYGTVILSLVQSFGIATWLQSQSVNGLPIVIDPGLRFTLMTVLTLTTGTAFIMWLGEQISDRGIGNGISLIIFAGIVVGLPDAVARTLFDIRRGTLDGFAALILLVVMVLVVAAVVFIERGQRRIPVQYARRVVGRRVHGGASSYLPLRVNTAGVIPVIFASSMLAIPQSLGRMTALREVGWLQPILAQLDEAAVGYDLLYFSMIVFFCFFYVSIVFNPMDHADNMKKYGGFVPGIRPGKRTADYIDRILTRLTFGGAIYLGVISLMPIVAAGGFPAHTLPVVGPLLDEVLPRFITQGLLLEFSLGGTSLLIVVGVAMDTLQQIESQLVMRHYEGFMKGSRIRGRKG